MKSQDFEVQEQIRNQFFLIIFLSSLCESTPEERTNSKYRGTYISLTSLTQSVKRHSVNEHDLLRK
jgi:hypothetical protein